MELESLPPTPLLVTLLPTPELELSTLPLLESAPTTLVPRFPAKHQPHP